MKKRVFDIFRHPEVKNDLREAIDYYNEKKTGLGNTFYLNAKKYMESLKHDTLLYEIRFENTRFLKIGKFPYVIYYYVSEQENIVYIDAVKCTYRDPEKHWKSRNNDML
jgi:toxin ParE1/3/4